MKTKWIVHYACGCTDEASRKKDLLDYCGVHGMDAQEWYHIPAESLKDESS